MSCRLSKCHSGQGWYFTHGGSNWGFQCNLLAHIARGYGVAVMTNGDNGGQLVDALIAMIQKADQWDVLDQAPPRGYGPIENAATVSQPSAPTQSHVAPPSVNATRTTPLPESEPMLRSMIAAFQKGELDPQATPEPLE